MKGVSGRVALVTGAGAAGGIGFAIAKALVAGGAKVGGSLSAIGRLRVLRSAVASAVSQKNSRPRRLVRITSENMAGSFGARALPRVETISFTPPSTASVSRST